MSFQQLSPWLFLAAVMTGVLGLVVVPRVRLVDPRAARALGWGTVGLALNGSVALLGPYIYRFADFTSLLSTGGMIGFWVGVTLCVYFLAGGKEAQS